VRLGLGVGVLASMAVEVGTDDDLAALDAIGLFPRLTTWLGFREDLLLKDYHLDFIRQLAPHLPESLFNALKREGSDADLSVHLEGVELPLRDGPVEKFELRG